MRTFIRMMIVAVLLTTGLRATAADKVVISTQKKRMEANQGPVGAAGQQAKGAEKVTYEVKLENQTLQDLSKLTVDYVIFVERQKLGERQGQEGHIDRFNGSKNIEVLTNREPQMVTTQEIQLNASNLVGTYHYANGGRIKAQDNVVGVWVRVSQDGQMIGEYTNPPTVTKRGWEQK